MAVATAEKLKWYYPLKTLGADYQPCPELSCEAGGDISNLINSGLTEANDYWNGAIGRFDLDTTTASLRGVFFHVKDFVAATDQLVLAKPLPVVPEVGGSADTFRLFFGGSWRSSEQIADMFFDAALTITGVTLTRVSVQNGAGYGLLSFNVDETILSWAAPGESSGPSVELSGDGDYVLYSDSEEKWITVTVDVSELPASTISNQVVLWLPYASVVPDWEGDETSGSGKTRYHLVVIENSDDVNDMLNAHVYVSPDTDGDATTLQEGVGVLASSARVLNASGWPTRSFWVLNSTRDDVRYVRHRTGNVLYYEASGAGLRGKTAVDWSVGDSVEVYPEVDIGLDAPSSSEFEGPADETTAPSGVTFDSPKDYSSGLVIGTLGALDLYGIWIRETILEDHRTRADFSNQITVEWM